MSFWELAGTYLAVLAPLVAVPLTVLTFYLRSLQDQQSAWKSEALRMGHKAEGGLVELKQMMNAFERDFATKEEWLRSYMEMRHLVQDLKERIVRLETLIALASRGTTHAERT